VIAPADPTHISSLGRRGAVAAWAASALALAGCGDELIVAAGVIADGLDRRGDGAAVDGWFDVAVVRPKDVPSLCPGGPGCTCDGAGDGVACSDHNPCTWGEACKGGACQGGRPVLCEAVGTCGVGWCDALTGGCAWGSAPDGTACSDGSACTVGDRCKGGACLGHAQPCDDANPCTDDGCSPAIGCSHAATGLPCSDGNACTFGDVCAQGACAGMAPSLGAVCFDANPCTLDQCDAAKGCVHLPQAGACDDGNPCSGGDQCKGGACQPGLALACACTTDGDCAAYDDGNPCTGTVYCDTSVAGHACKVAPGSIPKCPNTSGKPCLASGCDAATGACTLTALSGACDDGDPCTVASACQAGTCTATVPSQCDDANPCTEDGCGGAQGCWHQPAKDGKPCSVDGFAGAGQCKAGKCSKPCKLFEGVFGGPGYDIFNAVAAAPVGGWIAAGATTGLSTHLQGWIVRFGDDNQIAWQLALGATATDLFTAVAAGTSTFCAAGESTAPGSSAAGGWVVRTDLSGKVMWQQVAGKGENARFWGVAASSSGCVAVGRRTPPTLPLGEGWVVAFGPGGAVTWEATLGYQSNDELRAVASLGPNGLLTAGWSFTDGPQGDADAWLVRLTPTGAVTFDQRVGTAHYEASAAILHANEYFYAAGTAGGPDLAGFDGHLVASTIGGQIQWQKTIGWKKDDRIHGLALIPSGGAMLAVGASDSFGQGDTNGWVVRLDASGKLAWVKTFGSDKNDLLAGAAQIQDGGVIAVGTWGGAGPNGEGAPNAWVLRFDSDAATSCD